MPKKKKNNIPKAERTSSPIKGASISMTAQKSSTQNLEEDFLISFKYLDRNQGQSLEEWESDKILAKAMDVLRNYCCGKLVSQQDKKFTIYGDFPPKNKTEFTKPINVPEDAKWARIHITGTQIVAGYINKNVFNIVFLDKAHVFYKSDKKHT